MNTDKGTPGLGVVGVRLYGSRAKVAEIARLLAELGFDIHEGATYPGHSAADVALYATIYPRQLYPRRWLPIDGDEPS